jgi:hypothetical protein
VAQTLAVDLGSSTAVLDPVEGLTEGTKTRTTYSYANKPRSPGRRERVRLTNSLVEVRDAAVALGERPAQQVSGPGESCAWPSLRADGTRDGGPATV